MVSRLATQTPSPAVVLELLKPVTWFPPMWAFMCGIVSSGSSVQGRWSTVAAGVLLAGPLVCATSQAVNDWFDRHVDAINEPHRPIPSGRLPGRWGLYVAICWTLLSLAMAVALGPTVLLATVVGLGLAWAYSAPPVRLKRNGWWGNAACGVCYEGLAWITGAALLSGASALNNKIFALALLYSVAAHGIMTLNDFKSIEGDRRTGIDSLPVLLGPHRAALTACGFMLVPQLIVMALLAYWGAGWAALAIGLSCLLQVACMRRLCTDPRAQAPWYNATGVSLLVLGMLVSAIAVR